MPETHRYNRTPSQKGCPYEAIVFLCLLSEYQDKKQGAGRMIMLDQAIVFSESVLKVMAQLPSIHNKCIAFKRIVC